MKCQADMHADPPRDCDAPYCGCNEAWHECIEMLQEGGWREPEYVWKLERALREIKVLGDKFKDPYIPGLTFAKMAAEALATSDGDCDARNK